MLAFIQAHLIYFGIGFASFLLLIVAYTLSLSIVMRRIAGLQRQQSSNFKNIVNACRYLIELNRKVEGIEKQTNKDPAIISTNKMFRTDSAYQYAIQLFQSGRNIDEVVESCQLSWGEAELIQALHAK